VTDRTITAQLAAYEVMSVAELTVEYERLFNEKPRCRHKVWLRRNCAWRVQELAYGGLSEAARARLEQLMHQVVVPGIDGATIQPARPRDPAEPPVGTVLTRDWHGRQIRVTTTERGYVYEGREFKSLSAVATHVTGTKWNGRLWFGLAPARSRR
jgi:hypothetical protein